MKENELIKIWEDTFERTSNDISKTYKRYFNNIKVLNNNSKTIKEFNNFDIIKVSDNDTVSELCEFRNSGKTAILNMTSDKKPGGGVKNGKGLKKNHFLDVPIFHIVLMKNFIH